MNDIINAPRSTRLINRTNHHSNPKTNFIIFTQILPCIRALFFTTNIVVQETNWCKWKFKTITFHVVQSKISILMKLELIANLRSSFNNLENYFWNILNEMQRFWECSQVNIRLLNNDMFWCHDTYYNKTSK